MDAPGLVDGRHYTTYVDAVLDLKRRAALEAAEQLLLRLVAATEAEARAEHLGVAPWYYEQLAIIYRKQRAHAKELGILERYEQQAKAPGAGPGQLAARLAKLRQRPGGGGV